jgi:hypothetical protein
MAVSSTPLPADCPEPSLRPSTEPGEICGAAIVADARCLGHLDSTALDTYLAALVPGSPVQARGVTFTKSASFHRVTFTKNADFSDATFFEDADLRGAMFTGSA